MRLLELESGDGGGDLNVGGDDMPVLSGGVDDSDEVDELDDEMGVLVERERIELFIESLFLLFRRLAFLSMHGDEAENFLECFKCDDASSSSSWLLSEFGLKSAAFATSRFILVDLDSISLLRFSKII